MEIFNIVLTGGQCGGKSHAMVWLKQKLEQAGVVVYTVPETASMLINMGFDPSMMIPKQVCTLQEAILKVQLAAEYSARLLAQDKMRYTHDADLTVILYDRGLMDGSAFVDETDWIEIVDSIEELGYDSMENICVDSYEAVFHLTTAANGASEAYDANSKNNPARYGDKEFAIKTDEALKDAWRFHPNHHIIDNKSNFAAKMIELWEGVCTVLSIKPKYNAEIERKWLVEFIDITPFVKYNIQYITQTYLVGDAIERRIRYIWDVESKTDKCTYTEKSQGGLKRWEYETEITKAEYAAFQKDADPSCQPLCKSRFIFTHNTHTFELDTGAVYSPHMILECELSKEDEVVELPPFIKVIKEVTNDPTYKNANLAKLKS